METVTHKELCKIVTDNDYKKVGLFDAQGKKIVAFNGNGVPPKNKLDQIARKLSEKGVPDGVYIAHCKNSFHSSIEPVKYALIKGDPDAVPPGPVVVHPMSEPTPQQTHVLTWDEALSNHKELEELRVQNANQEKIIEDLNQEIEELKQDLQEVDTQLSQGNSTKEWIETVVESLAPAIDQFVGMRNKQTDLQSTQLYMQMVAQGMVPPPPNAPMYQQPQPPPAQPPQQPIYQQQVPHPTMSEPPPDQEGFDINQPPPYESEDFLPWCTWAANNYPEVYQQLMQGGGNA